MDDSLKQAALAKATTSLTKAKTSLQEAVEHLEAGEYLGALGAISGLASQIQHVETLLMVLRDLDHWNPEQLTINGG